MPISPEFAKMGEKFTIFTIGIGLGALITQEALVVEGTESMVPLVIIGISLAFSAYFTRQAT